MSTTSAPPVSNEQPGVLVVDGSRVVRRLIEQMLKSELPEVIVHSCASGAEALDALQQNKIDLVITALGLADMDGMELARRIREPGTHAYIPIIVVSGDVQERLVERAITDHVTDYFDKALGFNALAAFIRGYIQPVQTSSSGDILYVEDSRVVALATRRMLEKHGLTVNHVTYVEEALEHLETARAAGQFGCDLVLTDVNLKGELTGNDLLERVRGPFALGKGEMPVLVMTGDDNPANQATLLRAGANDLVQKPIDERLLITKVLFQMRVGQHVRARLAAAT